MKQSENLQGIRMLSISRLAVSAGLALALLSAGSKAIVPEPIHESAGPVVAELLSRYHYNDLAVNDALSQAVYTDYFEALDPQRFYFLESDIEAFSDRAARLDDELANGELDTAFAIFTRYQERVRERSEQAIKTLNAPLDFDTDLSLELDRQAADWAQTKAELDDLWQRRVLNDVLTQKINGRELPVIRESLEKRYQRLASTLEQYTAEDVFQAFMSTWAAAYDPHSSYMSPRNSENFDINMRLSLEGIGAMLSSEGDFVEIVELITGGPADASGELQSGDRIVGVGEDEDSIEDVVGWRLGDVVDLIRGPKNSAVFLRILPANGDGREQVIRLVRNTIELDEQAAQADVTNVTGGDDDYAIGVINIPAFYADFNAANAGDPNYRSTTRDVRRLLMSDELQNVDGVVIDLRGNAGGSLEEAIQLTGLFIDQGPVVQVHRSNGRREVLNDPEVAPAMYKGPLGVMVDGNSASASEIFAAAIQDYGRGVVMGDQTFGKGTVQTLIGLDRFGIGDAETPTGRLKLTIAKFYRINGESTQLTGVMPDLEMPYPHANDTVGERAADNALPWDTIRSADYRRLSGLDPILGELRHRHNRRLDEEPALLSVADEARRLEREATDTRVSLNQAKRMAALEASEAARLKAVNQQLRAYGKPTIESLDDVEPDALPDVLLDEAAAVMADLIELTNAQDRLAVEAKSAQAAAR